MFIREGLDNLLLLFSRTSNCDLDKTWSGQTKKERERFYDFRHDVPDTVNEVIKKTGQIKVGTDIAVPDGRLNAMLSFYKAILGRSGIDYLIFGHIGNSHLHVNMLPRNEAEHKKAGNIYIEFVRFRKISSNGL